MQTSSSFSDGGCVRSTPGPEKAAFNDREAATYLGISQAGFWRLLRAGKLPRVRIGGRTLVRRVDLDAFLSACLEATP